MFIEKIFKEENLNNKKCYVLPFCPVDLTP